MATKRKTAEPTEAPAPEAQTTAPQENRPDGEPRQSWQKRAAVIADPEAGVKFHFDYENHTAVITFNEKPLPELLEVARPILKDGGFEWDGKSDMPGWTKPIPFATRETERTAAKRTFFETANALRAHKGLPTRSFGGPDPF